MKTIKQINKLTDEKFRRVFGSMRNTFFFILEKLDNSTLIAIKRGRPPKINTLNRLCIFLAYYRHYRIMEDIANEYDISVSTIYDIIRLVEKTLMSCEEFKLPEKQDLEDNEPRVVVIDATECEIRRTKRGFRLLLREKEKIYAKSSSSNKFEILSVDFSGGRTHDFKLFKQSNLTLSEDTLVIADKGYQGIKKIHEIITHPIKRKKIFP